MLENNSISLRHATYEDNEEEEEQVKVLFLKEDIRNSKVELVYSRTFLVKCGLPVLI